MNLGKIGALDLFLGTRLSRPPMGSDCDEIQDIFIRGREHPRHPRPHRLPPQ
jgi:hypothetical protein